MAVVQAESTLANGGIDAGGDTDTAVVHCHHRASRTGLALRAWLMRTNCWDEPTATAHLAELWPRLNLWNTSFTELLQSWE